MAATLSPRAAAAGAEQETLAVVGNASRLEIDLQRLGERVMARHGVLLAAALFVETQLPAGALGTKILDAQRERRADPREGSR